MEIKMKNTLLLIGGSSSERAQLHDIFESEYNLLEADNASQGILLLKQNRQHIAAVITDILLTKESLLEPLIHICHDPSETEVPVICLVSPLGTGQREEIAFLLGATDVVTKPYTANAIRRRIHNIVDLYLHKWNLEALVETQSQAIRNNNQVMVDTLSSIIEYRSTESGNHTLRVRRFVKLLLKEVAAYCPEFRLTEENIDQISSASALHDIGKVTIPDSILNKSGPLTDEEFKVMQSHTSLGGELVAQIGDIGDPLYLRYIYNIALYHHERWDGKGYPKGLKRDEIPICAHVVGLADVYDALTNPRVYKESFSHEKAVNMILNGECGKFAPWLLECFKRVRKDFKEVSRLYSDGYSPKSDQIEVPLPLSDKMNYELSALQMSQLKYLAVLHYLDDTVIEMDIDARVCHVIYNPNADFVHLFADANFEEMVSQMIRDGAHPKNIDSPHQMFDFINEELFAKNRRKLTFNCNIFSHMFGEYYPYEISLLRITADASDRKLIIIFNGLYNENDISHFSNRTKLPNSFSMFGLASGTLCCKLDNGFTVDYGVGSLLPLTGFTADEIKEQFNGLLINMIVDEDRDMFNSSIRNTKTDSLSSECQCRIICKNKEPVWVLGKIRKAIDTEGQAVFYILFVEINSLKETQKNLSNENRFHKSLTELSKGVLLEYDIKSNALNFAEHWEEHFGYPLSTNADINKLITSSHIHPDDIPLIISANHRLFNDEDTVFFDIRIANSKGKYLWCRIRCKLYNCEDGTPERIVAIIYDINDLKTDAIEQKKKAEYDALTKLLNKSSAKYAISEYLSCRNPDELSAMIILDLDNFKAVNDTLGHLYGDAVLSQMGITLKTLFRPQDIMARIGGDEFLIFMQSIPDKELVIDRCQLIVDTFHALLHKLMPKLPVSVSVGVAIAPYHGTEYSKLFKNADNALYTAKRNGKNRFCMYDENQELASIAKKPMPLTRIDSGETLTNNDDSFVKLIFRKLYESRDIDATINELLALIGIRFNVSRVYIFENNKDNTSCSNTFEWCNDGIEPQIHLLQNLDYETDLAGLKTAYNADGVLYCTDITELQPNLREIVEPQGIKSMLHCAIIDQGVFKGYIGFDECNENYLWNKEEISLLQFMSEILAVFLIKHRTANSPNN